MIVDFIVLKFCFANNYYRVKSALSLLGPSVCPFPSFSALVHWCVCGCLLRRPNGMSPSTAHGPLSLAPRGPSLLAVRLSLSHWLSSVTSSTTLRLSVHGWRSANVLAHAPHNTLSVSSVCSQTCARPPAVVSHRTASANNRGIHRQNMKPIWHI